MADGGEWADRVVVFKREEGQTLEHENESRLLLRWVFS